MPMFIETKIQVQESVFNRITRKIRWIYIYQAKILATLKRKYLMSLTPLSAALNALI